MIQQTQKNSTFNSAVQVLKRSKSRQRTIVPAKREMVPVKLPAIVNKKSPTNTKSISSAYIQTPLKPQIPRPPTTTVTNPSPPPRILKPIITKPQNSSIKEHVTKENLTQKVTLRCKSPRPGSAFSQSTTIAINQSQEQFQTNHPLQRMDVGSLLSESARKRLTRLFNKLDTDKDGHLSYPQVQRCLPANLAHAQMTFFRVLYDIISDFTYFGLQEFYATAIIIEIVATQDSTLWNTYLDDVDFNYYHDSLLELLEEFNNQCSKNRGMINFETLLQIIMKRIRNGKIERISNELEYVMPNIKTMKLNRLEFFALLPAIIYIESSSDHGQTLFRFREHSLLDTHMRQALLA